LPDSQRDGRLRAVNDSVVFRFTPIGPGSHYQIDDVYVDPWARS
jgi:hypothetical protein